MNYWIVMFRPETYEMVRKHHQMGAAAPHGNRFAELKKGDRFAVYVSGKCLLDGYGEVTNDPTVSLEPIFGPDRQYPHRCGVRFEVVNAQKNAKDLLWGLSPFSSMTMKTVPANYIFLKGGFMRISQQDFDWLKDLVDGKVHAISGQ